MTEAEILSIRNELTDIVVSVVSVSFGMVSAYIVGLWLFLKRAPFVLRALSFLVFSFGIAFMGVLNIGLHELLLGTQRAWAKLDRTATDIPGFGSAPLEVLNGLTQYEAAAALGALAFLAIYLALFLSYVLLPLACGGIGAGRRGPAIALRLIALRPIALGQLWHFVSCRGRISGSAVSWARPR
jgi:hypothetical protein